MPGLRDEAWEKNAAALALPHVMPPVVPLSSAHDEGRNAIISADPPSLPYCCFCSRPRGSDPDPNVSSDSRRAT